MIIDVLLPDLSAFILIRKQNKYQHINLNYFVFILPQYIIADFQKQALVQHNYLQQLHCTSLLALNSTLNNIAQSYAEYMIANNNFNHSKRPGLGENNELRRILSF